MTATGPPPSASGPTTWTSCFGPSEASGNGSASALAAAHGGALVGLGDQVIEVAPAEEFGALRAPFGEGAGEAVDDHRRYARTEVGRHGDQRRDARVAFRLEPHRAGAGERLRGERDVVRH